MRAAVFRKEFKNTVSAVGRFRSHRSGLIRSESGDLRLIIFAVVWILLGAVLASSHSRVNMFQLNS